MYEYVHGQHEDRGPEPKKADQSGEWAPLVSRDDVCSEAYGISLILLPLFLRLSTEEER